MKERQRWSAEEDALLRAYVKRYGPREWNLVSQRMNTSFQRDAKSSLERWKNYLSPSIKKGSLTEDERLLVIRLQAKHGNKWKKIAAEVPGRTAKRLSKWWEVFKEKQQRLKEKASFIDHIELRKYDHILENFAEKIVKQHQNAQELLMTTPVFPPWLSSSNSPSSPSVTLTLSPSPWLQTENNNRSNSMITAAAAAAAAPHSVDNRIVYELAECCRELEEGHQALAAHKKETTWRLRRVELQLETEKACRKREKMEEIEAKIRALREEQAMALDRIDADYREQVMCLRRDAEAKEQKLAEQWAASHMRMTKFLEQVQCQQRPPVDMNGR